MCGRVCSLSRVKGGVECCGVCHACPALRGRRARCCLCGYWRVVGEGVFPPFFVVAWCSPGLGEAKGGVVGRVFSFFFLCGECGRLWL